MESVWWKDESWGRQTTLRDRGRRIKSGKEGCGAGQWGDYQGKILHEGVRKYLPQADRVRVTEAEHCLAERMRLKRALQVVAAVAEAMERWPEGRWQIRGKKGKGMPAKWVTQSTEQGLLTRRYDGNTMTEHGVQDDTDSIEWFDE